MRTGGVAALVSALVATFMAGRAMLAFPSRPISLSERLESFPSHGLPLESEVVIHWNSHHVPFIEANSDRDAAFALGMVHAHLRWSQLAIARMIAHGRLSELAGPAFVDIDRGLRTLSYSRSAEDTRHKMGEAARGWVDRFVEGINLYQELATDLPHEFRVLGLKPEPWAVRDIHAIGRLAATDRNWLVWAALSRLRSRSDWPDLRRQMHGQGNLFTPRCHGGRHRTGLQRLLGKVCRLGGTSIVLAPIHTATGGAMIASDSQGEILLPNSWMIVGLKSPSYHAVGLMVPGQPVFSMGRSPHIAWGGTNIRAAHSRLVDISRARHAPVSGNRQRIGVRWWASHKFAVRETPHGPVVSDGPFLPEQGSPPIVLQWTGHIASNEIEAMLAASRAPGFPEFRKALQGFATPGQDMLYADRHGHVGGVMAGWIPDCPGPPSDLVPGPAEHAPAWNRMRSVSDLPYSLNPQQGFLVSGMYPSADSGSPGGGDRSLDDRAERIAALIQRDVPVTREAVMTWQHDVFQGSSVRLRDVLVGKLDALCISSTAEGAYAEVLRRMRNWDGHYRPDSAGAVSFAQFCAGFVPQFMTMRFGERDGLDLAEVAAGGNLLTDEIESASETILRVSLAKGFYTAAIGLEAYENWSEMHRLELTHPLSDLPFVGSRYRFQKYGLGGNSETLMCSSCGTISSDQVVRYGSNARHISDMSDPDANYFVLMGGQDGWLGSSTFLDQVPLWREGRYIQVPLCTDSVAKQFPHRQLLRK